MSDPISPTDPLGKSGAAAIDSLRQQVERQRKKGLAKYGVSVEEANLTASQWLQHAWEEHADQTIYLSLAMSLVQRLEEENRDMRARVADLERRIRSVQSCAALLQDLMDTPLSEPETGGLAAIWTDPDDLGHGVGQPMRMVETGLEVSLEPQQERNDLEQEESPAPDLAAPEEPVEESPTAEPAGGDPGPDEADADPDHVTTAEAARLLGRHKMTVNSAVRDGFIRRIRKGEGGVPQIISLASARECFEGRQIGSRDRKRPLYLDQVVDAHGKEDLGDLGDLEETLPAPNVTPPEQPDLPAGLGPAFVRSSGRWRAYVAALSEKVHAVSPEVDRLYIIEPGGKAEPRIALGNDEPERLALAVFRQGDMWMYQTSSAGPRLVCRRQPKGIEHAIGIPSTTGTSTSIGNGKECRHR